MHICSYYNLLFLRFYVFSLRFILFLLRGLWGENRLWVLPIRLYRVRLTQCSCVDAFVVDLVIPGCAFYGSTYFRLGTRRLPVILFVSHFECPLYPVVYCMVCLGLWKKPFFSFRVFFQEKNMFFSCFFRFFRFFFLASDFLIFKDLTYGYCKLMMLFRTQTFLLD